MSEEPLFIGFFEAPSNVAPADEQYFYHAKTPFFSGFSLLWLTLFSAYFGLSRRVFSIKLCKNLCKMALQNRFYTLAYFFGIWMVYMAECPEKIYGLTQSISFI